MKIIAPFGKPQHGTGTFDCLYDTAKYHSINDAFKANDYVEGNFVDDEGILKIELHNTKNVENKKYHTLNFQNCPFGLDTLDDNIACELAVTLF